MYETKSLIKKKGIIYLIGFISTALLMKFFEAVKATPYILTFIFKSSVSVYVYQASIHPLEFAEL